MGRVLRAVVVLLLVLAALELGVRGLGAGREALTADASIGYRLTPDFPDTGGPRRTDDLGLRRDGPTALVKAAGVTRILVLGDAQTEGAVDNEATFAARLEKALRGREGGAVEVLDAGVRGYSPLLEYLWLRDRGSALRPDVVVMVLYGGDDLGELVTARAEASLGLEVPVARLERTGNGWEIRRPGSPHRLVEIDHWLRSHLRAYALLRRYVHGATPPANRQLAEARERCPGCLEALWQPWLAQAQTGTYDLAPLALREVLDRFARLTREIGARPLLAILPTKLEVEPDDVRDQVQEIQRLLGVRTPPSTFAQAERTQMLAAAAARQLEVLDLLPSLRQAAQAGGAALYDSGTWQLTRDGHAAVAQALEPRLAELSRSR